MCIKKYQYRKNVCIFFNCYYSEANIIIIKILFIRIIKIIISNNFFIPSFFSYLIIFPLFSLFILFCRIFNLLAMEKCFIFQKKKEKEYRKESDEWQERQPRMMVHVSEPYHNDNVGSFRRWMQKHPVISLARFSSDFARGFIDMRNRCRWAQGCY